MNIRNHYLVPNERILSTTNHELHEKLGRLLDVTYGDGNEKQNNILVLLYLCTYISAEELAYYLGLPENSFKSLHVLLNYMEKKKYIKKYNLKSKDNCTRVLYYLTQDGFHMAAALFDTSTPIDFKKRGKDVTIMHDYSTGMNIFHLLLFNKPFAFFKEFSFGVSAATGRDVAGTLRVDGICIFKDSPYRIFFEEDLGNEKNGILLDKLVKYQSYGHMEHENTESIVFSFRKSYCTADAPEYKAYSPALLKSLHAYLMEHNYDSLGSFISSYSVSLPGSSHVNEMQDKSSADMYKFYTAATEVLSCTGIYNKKDHSLRGDMSLYGLSTFIAELEELKSDWKNKDLNEQQFAFTTAKFRMITGLILAKFRKAEMQTDLYMYALMRGYSVWCIPTALLSNYLPYICMGLSGMHITLEGYLKKLDRSITFKSFTFENRLKLSYGNPYPVNLRNIYTYSGGYIALEYVSKDIGGLARAVRFREFYLNEDMHITLLCLVDSYKDALFLSGKDYLNCDGIRFSTSNRVYFILQHELQHSSRLTPFIIADHKRVNINPLL